jgi:hypothetical protein
MSLTPKHLFRFFLLGAALVWLADKLYWAAVTGEIRSRRRSVTLESDPLSFDVYFALDAACVVIIAGMILKAVWDATQA